jgi:hypothetical protein
MSSLPGADVLMTTEELRDLMRETITGHSRKDSTDWDLNNAMGAVEEHVAYRLRTVMDRVKDEALRTSSEERWQALTWVARLLDQEASGRADTDHPTVNGAGQTPPNEEIEMT